MDRIVALRPSGFPPFKSLQRARFYTVLRLLISNSSRARAGRISSMAGGSLKTTTFVAP